MDDDEIPMSPIGDMGVIILSSSIFTYLSLSFLTFTYLILGKPTDCQPGTNTEPKQPVSLIAARALCMLLITNLRFQLFRLYFRPSPSRL